MLVLTRTDPRVGAEPIEVRLVDVRGDSVRIGVDAPAATKVHRKEVWDSIRADDGP